MNDTMLLAADSLAPFEEAKQFAPGSVAEAPQTVETGMKSCPVCRAHVFADMDTCFNCMYLFGSNPALEEKAAGQALSEVPLTQNQGNASTGRASLHTRRRALGTSAK